MAQILWKLRANFTPGQLISAAEQGDEPTVARLIEAGANPNVRKTREPDAKTAIYCAAENGHAPVCRRLVASRDCRTTNVSCTKRSWTPLHVASSFGHASCVIELLHGGADARKPTGVRRASCAHLAARSGSVDVLRALVDAGFGDLMNGPVDKMHGDAPIHSAIRDSGEYDAVHFLVIHGANVNATNARGDTPAHLAARLGHVDILPRLAADGADFSALDERGRDVYDLLDESNCAREFSRAMVVHARQTALRFETHQAEQRSCGCNQCIKTKFQIKSVHDNLADELADCSRQLQRFIEAVQIPIDSIQLTSTILGQGSYAEVRAGLWNGRPVAVKMYHELTMSPWNSALWKQEMSISCRISHPNVVAVYGVIASPETISDAEPSYIVMELLECNLEELLLAAAKTAPFSWRERVDLASDCVAGVHYLHRLRPQPYLHGDIRSSNVFVSCAMVAKIGDLGASHRVGCALTAGPLSWLYLAPERRVEVKRKGRSTAVLTSENTKEADVFSLGITLGEIFSGKTIKKDDVGAHVGAVVDASARSLCASMTAQQATRRPDVGDVLLRLEKTRNEREYRECRRRRRIEGSPTEKGVTVALL